MSILGSLIGPATSLLDKVIEDKDQKNALAHEIATMAERHAQELAKGQLEVNKVEAAHHSIFVSGWRPCIGWVCALGLLYNTILSNILGIWVEVPEIDTTLLVPVMMGMLGLGAMRSYEKVQGVSREK
jgi:roadblock/LC7 domain-containing protein